MSDARPFTLLIAALGGEGGGVLTDWIVSAAEACGLPVQSTSIPGVAQRTGATTYYIEIFPVPLARAWRQAPGARARARRRRRRPGGGERIARGRPRDLDTASSPPTARCCSRRRAASISRSRRCRWPTGATTSERLLKAAEQNAQRASAVRHGGGREAGGRDRQFRDARRDRGIGTAADPGRGLRGGDQGTTARRSRATCAASAPALRRRASSCPCALPRSRQARRASRRSRRSKPRPPRCPKPARALATEGVRRLVAYQDAGYARLYLDRLRRRSTRRQRQAARRDRAASRGAHVVRGRDPRRRGEDLARALPPHRGRDRRQGSALRHHRIPQARHRGTVPGAAAAACARDRRVFGKARLARQGLFRHGAEDHDRVGLRALLGACEAQALPSEKLALRRGAARNRGVARARHRRREALARSRARSRRMRAPDQGLRRHLEARLRQLRRRSRRA